MGPQQFFFEKSERTQSLDFSNHNFYRISYSRLLWDPLGLESKEMGQLGTLPDSTKAMEQSSTVGYTDSPFI